MRRADLPAGKILARQELSLGARITSSLNAQNGPLHVALRVVQDGWRYGVFFSSSSVAELDLEALCAVLRRTAPFLPAFIQAEVYIDSALAAVFHYQLRRQGGTVYYVGPARRFENGRRVYCCRHYYVEGGRVREGRRVCQL